MISWGEIIESVVQFNNDNKETKRSAFSPLLFNKYLEKYLKALKGNIEQMGMDHIKFRRLPGEYVQNFKLLSKIM